MESPKRVIGQLKIAIINDTLTDTKGRRLATAIEDINLIFSLDLFTGKFRCILGEPVHSIRDIFLAYDSKLKKDFLLEVQRSERNPLFKHNVFSTAAIDLRNKKKLIQFSAQHEHKGIVKPMLMSFKNSKINFIEYEKENTRVSGGSKKFRFSKDSKNSLKQSDSEGWVLFGTFDLKRHLFEISKVDKSNADPSSDWTAALLPVGHEEFDQFGKMNSKVVAAQKFDKDEESDEKILGLRMKKHESLLYLQEIGDDIFFLKLAYERTDSTSIHYTIESLGSNKIHYIKCLKSSAEARNCLKSKMPKWKMLDGGRLTNISYVVHTKNEKGHFSKACYDLDTKVKCSQNYLNQISNCSLDFELLGMKLINETFSLETELIELGKNKEILLVKSRRYLSDTLSIIFIDSFERKLAHEWFLKASSRNYDFFKDVKFISASNKQAYLCNIASRKLENKSMIIPVNDYTLMLHEADYNSFNNRNLEFKLQGNSYYKELIHSVSNDRAASGGMEFYFFVASLNFIYLHNMMKKYNNQGIHLEEKEIYEGDFDANKVIVLKETEDEIDHKKHLSEEKRQIHKNLALHPYQYFQVIKAVLGPTAEPSEPEVIYCKPFQRKPFCDYSKFPQYSFHSKQVSPEPQFDCCSYENTRNMVCKTTGDSKAVFLFLNPVKENELIVYDATVMKETRLIDDELIGFKLISYHTERVSGETRFLVWRKGSSQPKTRKEAMEARRNGRDWIEEHVYELKIGRICEGGDSILFKEEEKFVLNLGSARARDVVDVGFTYIQDTDDNLINIRTGDRVTLNEELNVESAFQELDKEHVTNAELQKFVDKIVACETSLNLEVERHLDLFYRVLKTKDESFVRRLVYDILPLGSVNSLISRVAEDDQINEEDKVEIIRIINDVLLNF